MSSHREREKSEKLEKGKLMKGKKNREQDKGKCELQHRN